MGFTILKRLHIPCLRANFQSLFVPIQVIIYCRFTAAGRPEEAVAEFQKVLDWIGVDVADSQSYEGDDDGDEVATNPSGIIGAASKEENAIEGLGINSTPERGINDDGYDTTPFSEMSNYTDTSRAPLGIASMRKMQQNSNRHDAMMSLPPLAYQ